MAGPAPRRGTRGPNGVWGVSEKNPNCPIGVKEPKEKKGFESGQGVRYWEKRYRPKHKLAEAEKIFAEEFGLKKDWAAELANKCFVANQDAIFEAFSRGLIKGDPKVYTALANRAYGLPRQEVSFGQDKPFTLVVEYIGEKTPMTIDVPATQKERERTPKIGAGGGFMRGDGKSREHMAMMSEKARQKRLQAAQKPPQLVESDE